MNSDSQSKFVYIKLYGSYGWRSADGTNAMVVGGGKEERIAKEPLLKWYLELFREVLTGPECNLLVIGYGFRDKLINEVIAHAIRDRKLRLYIISPHQPIHLSMQ
ncbi:MAG: SIR2 family protein, partial [Nitrospirota bacterium]